MGASGLGRRGRGGSTKAAQEALLIVVEHVRCWGLVGQLGHGLLATEQRGIDACCPLSPPKTTDRHEEEVEEKGSVMRFLGTMKQY